jgi:hypothetical protein
MQITNRKLSNFDEISVISFLIQISRRLNALSTQFHTSNVAHANFSVETIPANRKRNLSNFGENSVTSILIAISRRFNGLSNPFYTRNLAHANFSVKTIPANRKTQTFKFRRKLRYFIPDSDISAFKHSFHSILHDERCARQFQCRNNPCKSQIANFQISTKSLLFHSR